MRNKEDLLRGEEEVIGLGSKWVNMVKKFNVAEPDAVTPTKEATTIDTSPTSDCCAVCGFSEERGMIIIDVAGLPISSDEILWVEYSKCEQRDHQLYVDVESENFNEEIDLFCGKC